MPIRAVFFDVGETLIDETRLWAGWADWLGVPRFTFFATLGAVIDRGESHRRVFDIFRPGMDFRRERERREAAGEDFAYRREDLYPDVIPCLRALRAKGYIVGAAGNQPLRAEQWLRDLGLPLDLIGSSGSWGVHKPSREFFVRIADASGLPPHEIAYVGDRLDNDVLPAAEAGMVAVFLRRGPWGYLNFNRPEAERAAIRLESLEELPAALRAIKP